MKVIDLYNSTIKPLSTSERLSLAQLILSDIAPQAVVDYSEEWSDEDLRDFTKAGWERLDDADQTR